VHDDDDDDDDDDGVCVKGSQVWEKEHFKYL